MKDLTKILKIGDKIKDGNGVEHEVISFLEGDKYRIATKCRYIDGDDDINTFTKYGVFNYNVKSKNNLVYEDIFEAGNILKSDGGELVCVIDGCESDDYLFKGVCIYSKEHKKGKVSESWLKSCFTKKVEI